MAKVGVWSGTYELVVHFEDHFVAPISSEMQACPESEGNACESKKKSSFKNEWFYWHETPPKKSRASPFSKEQRKNNDQNEEAQKSPSAKLASLGSFRAYTA